MRIVSRPRAWLLGAPFDRMTFDEFLAYCPVPSNKVVGSVEDGARLAKTHKDISNYALEYKGDWINVQAWIINLENYRAEAKSTLRVESS